MARSGAPSRKLEWGQRRWASYTVVVRGPGQISQPHPCQEVVPKIHNFALHWGPVRRKICNDDNNKKTTLLLLLLSAACDWKKLAGLNPTPTLSYWLNHWFSWMACVAVGEEYTLRREHTQYIEQYIHTPSTPFQEMQAPIKTHNVILVSMCHADPHTIRVVALIQGSQINQYPKYPSLTDQSVSKKGSLVQMMTTSFLLLEADKIPKWIAKRWILLTKLGRRSN